MQRSIRIPRQFRGRIPGEARNGSFANPAQAGAMSGISPYGRGNGQVQRFKLPHLSF